MTEKEIKTAEKYFLKELNFFKFETDTLIKYVYSQGTLNDVIIKNKSVNKAVNKNPSFWNSVLFSFIDSMFIVLGRIFDTTNNLNQKSTIHTLFKLIDSKREIFSKENFSKRWIVSHPSMLNYKDKYLESFYKMSVKDWRELKKLKSSLNKEYQSFYKPIRDSIAHRILTDNTVIKSTMSKVTVNDMEKFCTKLSNLHENLWQLYYNGRGPVTPLKRTKYSSKGFINSKHEPFYSGPLAYQHSLDTKQALILLSKGITTKIINGKSKKN